MTNLRYRSITEVSELIRQKHASPVELVTECLESIEQLQPHLNAFITVTAQAALQEAKQAEREIQQGTWKGPLHGIPVGIKDFFDTAGIRTTAAFARFERSCADKRCPRRDPIERSRGHSTRKAEHARAGDRNHLPDECFWSRS